MASFFSFTVPKNMLRVLSSKPRLIYRNAINVRRTTPERPPIKTKPPHSNSQEESSSSEEVKSSKEEITKLDEDYG
ncbi:hypothetical protein ACH5RR_002565 [Cinchona calisaya]|uniref:Uncharacterized protein n=1 Tax=Cinchona calisaya TaxID=153742 RepID=A0ABD3ASA9_9GENT